MTTECYGGTDSKSPELSVVSGRSRRMVKAIAVFQRAVGRANGASKMAVWQWTQGRLVGVMIVGVV